MKKKKEERESWESTWYEVQVQKRREKNRKLKKRVPESVCQSKVCGKKKLKKNKNIILRIFTLRLNWTDV